MFPFLIIVRYKIMKHTQKFYHNLHVWYHELLTNLIIFGFHFFRILKSFENNLWSKFLVMVIKISFDFTGKILNWAKWGVTYSTTMTKIMTTLSGTLLEVV
jgi:hypothetical protein